MAKRKVIEAVGEPVPQGEPGAAQDDARDAAGDGFEVRPAPAPARARKRAGAGPAECAVSRLLPGGAVEVCEWYEAHTGRRLRRFPLDFVGGREFLAIPTIWGGGTYQIQCYQGTGLHGARRTVTFEGAALPAYANPPTALAAPAPAPAAPAVPEGPAGQYAAGLKQGLDLLGVVQGFFSSMVSREREESDARIRRLELEADARLKRERADSQYALERMVELTRAAAPAPAPVAAPHPEVSAMREALEGLLERVEDLSEESSSSETNALVARGISEGFGKVAELVGPIVTAYASEKALKAEVAAEREKAAIARQAHEGAAGAGREGG